MIRAPVIICFFSFQITLPAGAGNIKNLRKTTYNTTTIQSLFYRSVDAKHTIPYYGTDTAYQISAILA